MTATETIDVKPRAYAVIDGALERFRGRTLLSGTEVVDILLDLRLALDVETGLDALLAPVSS